MELLGQWIRVDVGGDGESMELFSDGKAVIMKGGISVGGTWSVVDKRFRTSVSVFGMEESEAYNYTISGYTLTLVNNNETLTYLRKKQAKEFKTKQTKQKVEIAKQTANPAPKEEQVVKKPVEENLDELASLFEALPVAKISTRGDFKFHRYLNHVRGKIEQNWKPPTQNRNLAVEVSFTVNSDGIATGISVSKSSGNTKFDNLAVRAVVLVSPFGKLPPGFSGDRLEISCTFRPTRNM